MDLLPLRARLLATTVINTLVLGLFYLAFYPCAVGHARAYLDALGFRIVLGLSVPIELVVFVALLFRSAKHDDGTTTWRRVRALVVLELVVNLILTFAVVGVGTI